MYTSVSTWCRAVVDACCWILNLTVFGVKTGTTVVKIMIVLARKSHGTRSVQILGLHQSVISADNKFFINSEWLWPLWSLCCSNKRWFSVIIKQMLGIWTYWQFNTIITMIVIIILIMIMMIIIIIIWQKCNIFEESVKKHIRFLNVNFCCSVYSLMVDDNGCGLMIMNCCNQILENIFILGICT